MGSLFRMRNVDPPCSMTSVFHSRDWSDRLVNLFLALSFRVYPFTLSM